MPELPEVETIVRELRETILNKKVWKLEELMPGTIVCGSFCSNDLKGEKITAVLRRGKFIVLELGLNARIVVHLRMTGRLIWGDHYKNKKHMRALFTFSDGSRLFFGDMRRFGKIWICNAKEMDQLTGMIRLGVEPVGNIRGDVHFRGRKGILKNTLLRQDLIAGIGNIYADEICFRSGLHPSRRMETLNKNEMDLLKESIVYCLQEGIKNCGVSMSDFVGTHGNLGKHQKYLQIYGRAGDNCYICRSVIEKVRIAGRGTHFCPTCQN